MIKKIILLSALGFSLTGCVMAPYDDRPHYSGSYNSYDRPHWNNGTTHRPDYRPNHRPNDRPHQQKPKPHQTKPHFQGNKPPVYRPPVNRPSFNRPSEHKPNYQGQKPSQHKPNHKPNDKPNHSGQRPSVNKPSLNSNYPRPQGLPNAQRPLRPSV